MSLMPDDAAAYIGQLSPDRRWRWDGTAWTDATANGQPWTPAWASLALRAPATWSGGRVRRDRRPHRRPGASCGRDRTGRLDRSGCRCGAPGVRWRDHQPSVAVACGRSRSVRCMAEPACQPVVAPARHRRLAIAPRRRRIVRRSRLAARHRRRRIDRPRVQRRAPRNRRSRLRGKADRPHQNAARGHGAGGPRHPHRDPDRRRAGRPARIGGPDLCVVPESQHRPVAPGPGRRSTSCSDPWSSPACSESPRPNRSTGSTARCGGLEPSKRWSCSPSSTPSSQLSPSRRRSGRAGRPAIPCERPASPTPTTRGLDSSSCSGWRESRWSC